MKITIQIKSIFGEVLFEFKKDNNTVRDTLVEAIKQGADLRSADLRSASLYGANLYGANLYGANLYGADLRSADLRSASLYGANLRSADLRSADLRSASLYGANLRSASLYGADLRSADLRSASLYGANLYGANLYGANLRSASLRSADLRSADLRSADLRSANLYGADLRSADLRSASLRSASLGYYPMNCPSDGAFVGWKKVGNKLVKLLILEDSKRSSATSMKCRCDKAQVLAITSLDEKENFESVVNANYNPHIEYKVGEIVYPDKFDEDRWNECSNGIHFFINKQDAIDYN